MARMINNQNTTSNLSFGDALSKLEVKEIVNNTSLMKRRGWEHERCMGIGIWTMSPEEVIWKSPQEKFYPARCLVLYYEGGDSLQYPKKIFWVPDTYDLFAHDWFVLKGNKL